MVVGDVASSTSLSVRTVYQPFRVDGRFGAVVALTSAKPRSGSNPGGASVLGKSFLCLDGRQCAGEIIDEYVDLGFDSVFLRSVYAGSPLEYRWIRRTVRLSHLHKQGLE
jgi:hypothetical protein